MAERNPTIFDEGHGPLSSVDERVGGLAGGLIGAAAGYDQAGVGGAIAGGLMGWAVGEAVHDPRVERALETFD